MEIKEHVSLLLSLVRKGARVFENVEEFIEWLNLPNVFMDNKKPVEFLDTISGITFIDNRLTAMEYGDNI